MMINDGSSAILAAVIGTIFYRPLNIISERKVCHGKPGQGGSQGH
jgi:hypothetical protein